MDDSTPKHSAGPAGKQKRDQSNIQFPYGDLSDAISVANAMMKNGGVPCEPDQLAAALGQTPTSGNFRMKVATARIFGVIETVQGKYQLTDLGFNILDKDREKAARVEAFLRVPLYRKVYEDFKGKMLPPRPAALQRTFVEFGVAPKQGERARQAFDRSAQQAGFFDQAGRERLIRPLVSEIASSEPAQGAQGGSDGAEREREGGGGNNGGGRRPPPGDLHPFIQGLLDTLPEPETTWTVEGRAKWLQAAANIFDLIYKGDGVVTVKAQPDHHAEHGSGHGA